MCLCHFSDTSGADAGAGADAPVADRTLSAGSAPLVQELCNALACADTCYSAEVKQLKEKIQENEAVEKYMLERVCGSGGYNDILDAHHRKGNMDSDGKWCPDW